MKNYEPTIIMKARQKIVMVALLMLMVVIIQVIVFIAVIKQISFGISNSEKSDATVTVPIIEPLPANLVVVLPDNEDPAPKILKRFDKK